MTHQPEQWDGSHPRENEPRLRSTTTLLALAVCAALLFTGFLALGTWQMQRMQWKKELIERIEQRAHAVPVPAPGPDRWADISAESEEYRRVQISGVFLHNLSTKVKASTVLGSGHWLLTPLRTEDGSLVIINRGFIPGGKREAGGSEPRNESADKSDARILREDTVVTVTGLLRMSEPGWPVLRRNDAANNRWYSRDVEAIAEARNLSRVAPYFIDADASSSPRSEDGPVGGLTVLTFPNNHLVYALTWYALALMVAGAGLWVGREEWRLKRRAAESDRAGHH